MRLADLEPHWVGLLPGHAFGVTFLCPCCKTQRIGVMFDPPIGDELADNLIGFNAFRVAHFSDETKKWKRTGDTFDTLTLLPSVDTSAHGHWHGFITQGEVK